MSNNSNKNNSRGFTLIELIISIVVLSVAVIGAYNAFTTMDILTASSTDRFVAAYLAQEGIEIVRNIRDTNWIRNDDWREGLYEEGVVDCTTNGCQADYKTFGESSTPLVAYAGQNLYIDENGFYNYASGTQTKFRRKIVIIPMQTLEEKDDILRVIVTVYWDEKANMFSSNPCANEADCSIEAEEYLYNWY
jgi:prepilin-type N-terminal cleavage/methylation domain-containing protein